jgi:hypothetical protein
VLNLKVVVVEGRGRDTAGECNNKDNVTVPVVKGVKKQGVAGWENMCMQ